MRFKFATSKLLRLYTEEVGKRKLPSDVVEAFFEVMTAIDSAQDEQDLRSLKQLHFEKLKGKRKHQRSLKLHGGFRLVVQVANDQEGTYLLIEAIEDYH